MECPRCGETWDIESIRIVDKGAEAIEVLKCLNCGYVFIIKHQFY